MGNQSSAANSTGADALALLPNATGRLAASREGSAAGAAAGEQLRAETVSGGHSDSGFPWWVYLLLVLGVVAIAAVVYSLWGNKDKKKKRTRSAQPAQEPLREVDSTPTGVTARSPAPLLGAGRPTAAGYQAVAQPSLCSPMGPYATHMQGTPIMRGTLAVQGMPMTQAVPMMQAVPLMQGMPTRRGMP